MEAMSPQQETLGGQPGRSSSLTGMSWIAGGSGTKKVRMLRGAPRPPLPQPPPQTPLSARALRAGYRDAGAGRRGDLTLGARGPASLVLDLERSRLIVLTPSGAAVPRLTPIPFSSTFRV